MKSDASSAENTKPIIIVSTISKSSGRLVIGIPSRFEGAAKEHFAKAVRVTIEPLV